MRSFIKPEVDFDPANLDHRSTLAKFILTSSWVGTQFRFKQQGTGNHIAQLQRQLLEYYVNQEFTLEEIKIETVS